MRPNPWLCRLAATLLMLAGIATGQCQFNTVAVQQNGTGCNPVFLTVPTLNARLDPSACAVAIQVTAFAGCCNAFLRNRVLVLGDGSQSIPYPQIGQGCVLLVNPVVFSWLPTSSGDTFWLTIPPGLTGFTFHAQGAGHYVTFGVSHDLALTAGAALTLQ